MFKCVDSLSLCLNVMTVSGVTLGTFVHLFWGRIYELSGAQSLPPQIELVMCLCAHKFYRGSGNLFYACNASTLPIILAFSPQFVLLI